VRQVRWCKSTAKSGEERVICDALYGGVVCVRPELMALLNVTGALTFPWMSARYGMDLRKGGKGWILEYGLVLTLIWGDVYASFGFSGFWGSLLGVEYVYAIRPAFSFRNC
jgi:hypothetical protein